MSRAQCTAHGLAVGEDGRCVLCRRSQAPASWVSGSIEPPAPSRRLHVLIAALLTVFAFGVAFVVRLQSFSPAPSAGAPQSAGFALSEESAPSEAKGRSAAPGARIQENAQQSDETVTRVNALRSAQGEFAPAVTAKPSEPMDPAAAKQQALRAEQAAYEAKVHREAEASIRESEARERARHQPAPGQASGPEVRGLSDDARSRVSIMMYSTSWCGVCRAARRYMQGAGIVFTERDIEMDSDAAAEQRRLNPRGGVPTFDIDGTVLVGFDKASLETAISNAAARR